MKNMAYIHVKRIGDKKYYTLRVSIRQGDQVITKDIANLGSDPTKIKIEKLEKQYGQEIRKSYTTIKKFLDSNKYLEKVKKLKLKQDDYLTKTQLLEIEAIQSHHKSRFLKLDKLTQEEALENFSINFAVNSTAIEGNTITMKEAYLLLKEDIMPKNKKLREVHDLTNTKKVIEFLRRENPEIDQDLIIKIHDMLLENIDKREGLRNHDIRIFGQSFKPSPARYVKADLSILIKWYNENNDKLHPLVLATLSHHKFEKIHPFSDGNGRTGRMIMNHMISLAGYPPLVISRRFRKEYLKVMSDADKILEKGLTKVDLESYKSLIEFIVNQYRFSYWDIFLL